MVFARKRSVLALWAALSVSPMLAGVEPVAVPAEAGGKCRVTWERLAQETETAPRGLSKWVSGFFQYLFGGEPYRGALKGKGIGFLQLAGVARRAHWNPVQVLDDLHRKYGDKAYLQLPNGDTIVFVSDPVLVHEVLRETDKGKDYGPLERSALQTQGSERAFGTKNVFTESGTIWRETRKAMIPYFKPNVVHRPENIGKMTAIVDARIRQLREELGREPGTRRPVRIDHEVNDVLVEMVLKTLFNAEVSPAEIKSTLRPALDRAMSWVVFDTAFNHTGRDLLGLPSLFGPRKHARAAFQQLYGLVDRIIDEHERNPAKHDDLVSALLKQGLPREQLRKQLATLIAASYETTSSYVTWALYSLAKEPAVQNKLRAQLDERLGDAPWSPERDVPYLDQVLDETLRMYTPFYLIIRRLKEPLRVSTKKGTENVPAGTHVVVSLFSMHRREAEWGVARTGFPADQFVPERWDPERLPTGGPEKEDRRLCAFGHGPHVCLGMEFAQTEARLLVSRLVQNFELNLPRPGYTAKISSGIATHPEGGLPLILTPRSKQQP